MVQARPNMVWMTRIFMSSGLQAEKRAGSVACHPSRLERGVGERCERKQSEADLHRHCDAPHLVDEEHIVAGENAKEAQADRSDKELLSPRLLGPGISY